MYAAMTRADLHESEFDLLAFFWVLLDAFLRIMGGYNERKGDFATVLIGNADNTGVTDIRMFE